MKTMTFFEVLGHTDTTEGRGPMMVVARFTKKNHAHLCIKSKEYSKYCVMGYQSPNDINNVRGTTINVLESFDEFEDYKLENIRKTALSKLTEKEKKALGL